MERKITSERPMLSPPTPPSQPVTQRETNAGIARNGRWVLVIQVFINSDQFGIAGPLGKLSPVLLK